MIALILTFALLGNVFAFLPRLVNLPAIEFLSTSRELSENEDVQLYKESVVVVRGDTSKGTGFLISDNGYIMTNHHVIDDESFLTVTFEEGERYQADVIESDEELDIAILQIELEETDHHVLEFADSWEPDLPVYVIGNPLFFNFIANEGQLLGMREDGILMLDAPIYRGNSGSPVINHDGKVVGVVYATSRVDYEGTQQKVGLIVSVEAFRDQIELVKSLSDTKNRIKS
ncbi:S1 family peptidase [Alteribacter populi]|uniref:S1 family peptidase n=1 Tax=Alteribacter populi TaxID=2011011 RepID=UPI000BBA7291|nr:serine protease [Alteribacter populi]